MHILTNRIVISLMLILGGTAYWEFNLRPVSGPLYLAAASDYHNHLYSRSLTELREDLGFQPNDPSILALMGWDALKTRQAASALTYFRRARRFSPGNSDPMLGEVYAEIALQKYQAAKRLLSELRRRYGETPGFKSARDALLTNAMPPSQRTDQDLPGRAGVPSVRPPDKTDFTTVQPSTARR